MAPASRTARASSSDKAPVSPSAIPESKAARSGGRRRENAASAEKRARCAQAHGRNRIGVAFVEIVTSRACSTQAQPAEVSAPSSSKSPGSRGRRGGRSLPAITDSRPASRSATPRARGSHTSARCGPDAEAKRRTVRQPLRVCRAGPSRRPRMTTGPARAVSSQASSRAGARRSAHAQAAAASTIQNNGRRRILTLPDD